MEIEIYNSCIIPRIPPATQIQKMEGLKSNHFTWNSKCSKEDVW